MTPPRLDRFTLISVLSGLAVLLFGVLPLLVLGARAFSSGLSPLWASLQSPHTWSSAWTSLQVSLALSLACVLLGTPSAWLLARTDVPGRRVLRAALALPYAIPSYIAAIGWIALLNPRSGVLNQALGAEVFNIYSLGGMIWVMALAYFPLVLLQVLAALQGVDPALEEAARISGAGPLRVAFSVTLPLVFPSVVSGGLLTFLIGLAAFGVPYLLGQPARVEVLTTSIYRAIDVGTDESLAHAVALALVLAAVAAVALAVNQRLVQRGRALVGGKAGRANLVALGPWRPVAAAALWTLAALALVVPLGSLALTSFTAVWGQGLTPDNLTLDNYLSVLTDRRTLGAAWNSAWLAALAASACVAVGAVAAYARARTKLLGRELLPRAAELPYALPGTVLALGLLLTFSQPLWVGVGSLFYVKLWMLNTPWLLLVAYCAKYMAFGVRGADAALTQVDRSLEEAARISGATPWQTFTHVVVPLLRPALVASWVLVFLPVLGEITMSILLFGPQTKTLGVLLFDYQSYESPPKAAVLASLLALSVLGGDALVRRLTGGKLGL